jgi:small GTP-binding protein
MVQQYKLILVGDAKAGKTTLVDRCKNKPVREYKPTLGVEVHPLLVNEGTLLKIWDTAGNPRFEGLRDAYYVQADGAIIMVDMTQSEEVVCDNLYQRYTDVRRVCPNIPIVLLCNQKPNSAFNRDLLKRFGEMINCRVVFSDVATMENPVRLLALPFQTAMAKY